MRTPTSFALAAALLLAAPALAQKPPAPFAAGDATHGRALAERDCVGCHAKLMNGHPERIYTRPDRRVTTPAKLLAQVQACNANLGKGYFPEEEEHVAAFLNLEYYKFAP
jgi:mono/diheme cytochrome c family protein